MTDGTKLVRARPARASQHGFSIIVLLFMVSVVGLGIFLGVARSDIDEKLKRNQKTEVALAQARQALIDYAIQYDQTHPGEAAGYLPCPDDGTGVVEGQSTPPCRTMKVSAIGKFPWYTLDMEALRDGSGECLWYAVSGTFKSNPKNTSIPFNWDAVGQFEIYADDATTLVAGSSADNWVAAVIIAPGAAQGATQVRTATGATPTCGGNYIASNYLDVVTGIDNGSLATPPAANGPPIKFIQGKESNIFNDRLVYITAADIFSAIEHRPDFYSLPGSGNGIVRGMMAMAAGCVAARAAANTSVGKALVWAADSNAFGSLSDFVADSMYTDASTSRFGRVPYDISQSSALTTGGAASLLMVPAYCNPGWSKLSGWWEQWKDQFFYAVAQAQAPDSPAGDCGSVATTCLTVNGVGPYAGVVLFGGKKLAGETRTAYTDRRLRANYLEGNNTTMVPGVGPATAVINNFVTNDNPLHPTLNDLSYCIKQDLTPVACP